MSELECPLARAAAACAGAPAILGPEGAVTCRQYDRRASAAAQRLRGAGLWPGDRLAIQAAPSAGYCILLMGCFRAGVVACPISPRLPGEGVEEALGVLGAAALARAEQDGSGGSAALVVEELAAEGEAPEWRGNVPVRQPAVAVFTSGSSGRPKPALLSYGNLHANARASNRHIPLGPGDRWLLSLPLHHVSGLGVVFRCLVSGAAVVIPSEPSDPAESLEPDRVTHVSLVATQLRRLLGHTEDARVLADLGTILLGGSAMPPRLIEDALAAGLPIRTSYGLTEMASQVATSTGAEPSPEGLRWGTPLVPGSVRVSAEGELEVNGPTRFLGYLRGESLEEPFLEGGWFRTGDLGELDEQGRLTVFGRRDSLIISGGENIQPEEIERELGAIDGVAQSIVVAVDDDEFGQRPVAFVQTESGAPADPEALRQALERRLARFKVPDAFLPWPEEFEPTVKVSRPAFTQAAREILAKGR